MDYDILIIGAGPGGYVAAIKGAQNGKKVCVIEKEHIGGACLNEGCIPTKTLLKSVELMDSINKASDFGIEGITIKDIKMDLNGLQKKKKEIVDSLVTGVRSLLKKNDITLIEGIAAFKDKNTITVNGKDITADSVIIATGSVPAMLDIPISDEMPLLTSTEVLEMKEKYSSMVIIGGGVIGVELAYFLSKIGIKITIVEFLDRILSMIDHEIIDLVEKQIKSMGIEIITGATVTEIGSDRVVYTIGNEAKEIECDATVMSVGRKPNILIGGLDDIGIKTERGAIVTDHRMQSNVKNVYAIGDVNGNSMLAHTASMEGLIAIDNICGKDNHMNYSKIPSAIYLNPEIASVGLTEEQARKKYGEVKIGKFPMMGNGKSMIEGNQNGFIKIICDKDYLEILGAHLYCIHATDMISELSLAMEIECTADELVNIIHPHPTISEGIGEAAHAIVGKAIHI